MLRSFVSMTTIIFLLSLRTLGQEFSISDPYLFLNASADDPLYTTYAAAMNRSRLYGDKGYQMDYYSCNQPLNYFSDNGGKIYYVWMINKLVIDKMSEYFRKPVVISSFPDMVILEYSPFKGIDIQECFFVYSSRVALIETQITNSGDLTQQVEVFPILDIRNEMMNILSFDRNINAYVINHKESPERLISDLNTSFGYPEEMTDMFTSDIIPYSYGGFRGDQIDFFNYIKTDFYDESSENDSLNFKEAGKVDFVSLHYKFNLKPGETKKLRIVRGLQERKGYSYELKEGIKKAKSLLIQPYIDQNVTLFKSVTHIDFDTSYKKLIYLSAFNLARSCMLPPAGETNYNFYVFSREPLWGWGHGHQVLHESLSMLAYAFLDPESARNSQRVYMEQQGEDGLIAYRHGPRGMQDYPHYSKAYEKDMSTTSAPFYSWINWEIYKIDKDQQFLEEAYQSGVKYMEWLIENRDADDDGLFEWGPYGIIENVRDWYNAVFQVSAERYLDVDKEDISDELECLDLTLMIINELKHLAKMAEELDLKKEAKAWNETADVTAGLVNAQMWDKESDFFYSINKDDHSFTYLTRDLRRQEIIGFLPLWAGTVNQKRADQLIQSLTDTTKFWRLYGVPTLSADDEWYNPYVDYCCKWNGPVWLPWDYMVFRGLINYGYFELARELGDKMLLAVRIQLSKNHKFWESYSPDNEVLNCPSNYIWDAIIARVLIDMEAIDSFE